VKKLPCACAEPAAATMRRTAANNVKSLAFIKRSLLEENLQFGE
jgi:hypothetical protein